MKRTRNRFHYQVRHCRRVENFQKIIENCIQDLFKEIKKYRGAGNQEELVIDGAIGEQIPEKFATVYGKLFNRENDGAAISAILEDINANINDESMMNQ